MFLQPSEPNTSNRGQVAENARQKSIHGPESCARQQPAERGSEGGPSKTAGADQRQKTVQEAIQEVISHSIASIQWRIQVWLSNESLRPMVYHLLPKWTPCHAVDLIRVYVILVMDVLLDFVSIVTDLIKTDSIFVKRNFKLSGKILRTINHGLCKFILKSFSFLTVVGYMCWYQRNTTFT